MYTTLFKPSGLSWAQSGIDYSCGSYGIPVTQVQTFTDFVVIIHDKCPVFLQPGFGAKIYIIGWLDLAELSSNI